MGRRIDVHSHYMGEVGYRLLTQSGLIPKNFPVPLWAPEAAIEFMDRHDIASQMLSLPFSLRGNATDPAFPAPLVRELNEAMADVTTRHPGRFGAFATLPFNSTDAALDEIEYALDVLNLDGVAVSSNVGGAYFGDAYLEPILAELGRREIPLFVHPIDCVHPDLNLGRAGSFVEFPMDTARNITNAILTGVFQRHPGLKLVLAHCGGVLPTLAWRIAGHLGLGQGPHDAQVDAQHVETVLRGFFYETALAASPNSLLPTFEVTGYEQILFGTDYGAATEALITENIQQLLASDVLDDRARQAIERDNAERLFPRFTRSDHPVQHAPDHTRSEHHKEKSNVHI
ncbi:amidohydrolase family protein [Microbacterium kyungheense]|uniref:Putative TIM-barrel fold metal-dependent hydrolase n=1 Tax=Microbacterium kyungheense TaxID=1263636 RepID=A0A543EUG1_9MICO|nr:amidohydrolase family protein [Microbacterium kyungheense]TQM25194.1 putative TIM-barrel fold metal-dependent hydrolase [Microbacterium kyungheense]